MSINSFEEIININDRKIEKLHVKLWGQDVNVKQLSSEQAEEISVRFSGIADDKEKMIGMRTSLVRISLVDDSGQLLIKNDNQAKQLGEKSSDAIKEIFEFCMEFNGFNSKVEDDEKN